ncbi:MAG: TetR/AcrR family transcriptional regulator [Acidimicrobiales bacterium]
MPSSAASPSTASSPSTGATSIATAQTRREQILDAALEIFVERGFLGATMDDIGEAVGMRAPSLYKHVRNKQELLAALMSRSINDVHRALEAAVESTDDPVLRLRRAFEAHVRYHAVHRLDALLGANELANLEPGPAGADSR